MKDNRNKMTDNKKAYYFLMDALLAAILLISGLLILSSYPGHQTSQEDTTYLSRDILSSLTSLKISDLNSSGNVFVKAEIQNGNITNLNNSALEQIGEYWAKNQTDKASDLIASILNKSALDVNMQVVLIKSLRASTDQLYSTGDPGNKSLSASRRMISGIERDKPLQGSSSSAYLRNINGKKFSTYAYFGGFVGQGNITEKMNIANATVTDINLEMDVPNGAGFKILINGITCNDTSGGSYYFGNSTPMTASAWNISNCKNFMVNGANTFVFAFTSLSLGYISGGYIKVSYTTSQFQQTKFGNSSRYYTPGIAGVVNLFDSFYIPGDLKSLSVYLHFNVVAVNNTFFMTIGNTTVFLDNTTIGEVSVSLNDVNLTSLNYSSMNRSTVPIRIGLQNVSYETYYSAGDGFGDIIVTTDVSGSMDDKFGGGSGSTPRDCSDPLLYDSTTQKLSVAMCVDQSFVHNVLINTTLNRVGLVSYTTSTSSTLPMTNNEADLDAEINGYGTNSYTCIACGLVSSYGLLTTASPPQLHKDTWKYWFNSQSSSPPAQWNLNAFDDSSWPEGLAPFGYNVVGVNTVITKHDNTSVNLWKNTGDDPGLIADFTSGILNYTSNTYGWNNGDDGWDWQAGNVYAGNATNVTMSLLANVGAGNYKLKMIIGRAPNRQASAGSYGIQFNITPELLAIIRQGAYAVVSFDWNWSPGDTASGGWDNSDAVWIKARFTNSSNTTVYLGSNLDANADPYNDIYYENNKPRRSRTGTFSSIVTRYVNGTGVYYLDFGGKLSRDAQGSNESGIFYFDNVQVIIINNTGNTYYRNSFNMIDTSRFSNATLYVASDDEATVYLNGNLIDNDLTGPHARSYWNRIVGVPMSNFVEGSNVIAVKLTNHDNTTGFFDLQLRANMTGRQSAILIMSDGDANSCVKGWTGTGNTNNCNVSTCANRACCPNVVTGAFDQTCPDLPNIGGGPDDTSQTAYEQLINLSCYLRQYKNISIYSVAFGVGVTPNGTKTLNLSAACDNDTHFYNANNISGLADVYSDIASSILTGFSKRESQVLVVTSSGIAQSTLYPDSYIEYNYTPIVSPPEAGDIELSFESSKFQNCTPEIQIIPGMRIIDSKITSYSGAHWTDYVSVNNMEIYNLSKYDSGYVRLGDPFIVEIPPDRLVAGNNSFNLKTGDDPYTNTNCSQNNSFIYTALIPSATTRTDVKTNKSGCKWTIMFYDGPGIIKIPSTYSGNKTCSYQPGNYSYDPEDSYDTSMYQLLSQLDIGHDGKIIVNINTEDLEVIVSTVDLVPFMWGPSVIEVRVWG